jgi:hypothetical protein
LIKEGSGGVGYEKMIMTSDYMQNINTKKVIPLIRAVLTLLPTFYVLGHHENKR